MGDENRMKIGRISQARILKGDFMEKEGETLIISDNNSFRLYSYKSEKELENLVIKHSKEIFGRDSIYIDSKKKLTSAKGISVIPDGLLLDFKRNKVYIMEVELSTHDIIHHISNQINRFKLAMNNNETHNHLAAEFYKKIMQQESKADLAKIQQIISSRFGIIILIDSISEKLGEVVNMLSQDGTEVIAVPFETFVDSRNNYIHKFTTFTKEALENESKKWTFKWTTIPIEKHLDKTDENMKDIFSMLSRQICSLPNVKEKSRKDWITYQTSPLKNFCTIKILPNRLEVHLKCDKSFIDKKGIAKNIERTPSWTFDKVFTVATRDDLEYAMNLIRQAYGCICKG